MAAICPAMEDSRESWERQKLVFVEKGNGSAITITDGSHVQPLLEVEDGN